MSSDYNSISQFFSHPLVLLLIGAVISGVFIPYFTNRAAKYQKGLEIKTDLVQRINESVTRLVISLNVLVIHLSGAETVMSWEGDEKPTGLYSRKHKLEQELEEIKKQLDRDKLDGSTKKTLEQQQKKVSEQLEATVTAIETIHKFYVESQNEFRQWKVSSAVIESQIRSYFPEFGKKTEAKRTWSAFSEMVDKAYDYAVGAYIDAISYGPINPSWDALKQNLSKEKEEIVVQIQNSSVSGLSEPLFRRFFRKFIPRHRVNQT